MHREHDILSAAHHSEKLAYNCNLWSGHDSSIPFCGGVLLDCLETKKYMARANYPKLFKYPLIYLKFALVTC